MPKEKQPLIEELTWPEARNAVVNSCKELADIIDEISPSKEFTVFKIRYPFGAKILYNKSFYLPNDVNTSVPIDDSSNADDIKNKLTYSAVPLGIITKNTAEIFLDIHRKIFSLAILGNDLELGIWEYFGWIDNYNITSGARSLYMLPKISETLSHKQLKKKFGVIESPPKHLYDHWKVFSQIAKSNFFPTNWFCEIIFLSDKWIEPIKKDLAWVKLALYISQKSWQHSNYGRKKAALDVVWEFFVRSLSNKELKFDPYVVDTLKHIIYISTGAVPASAPSTGNDESGPLKNIQMIYEDPRGYGLEEYIATIMEPQYFSLNNPNSVYYSLQLPTLLESLPRIKKVTSVIDNIRELSELLNCFLVDHTEIWSKLTIGSTPLNNLLSKLQIDYFHGDMFAYGDIIKSSTKMPECDQRLKYDPLGEKKRAFACNSSFLRGCVKISAKSTSSTAETKKLS